MIIKAYLMTHSARSTSWLLNKLPEQRTQSGKSSNGFRFTVPSCTLLQTLVTFVKQRTITKVIIL